PRISVDHRADVGRAPTRHPGPQPIRGHLLHPPMTRAVVLMLGQGVHTFRAVRGHVLTLEHHRPSRRPTDPNEDGDTRRDDHHHKDGPDEKPWMTHCHTSWVAAVSCCSDLRMASNNSHICPSLSLFKSTSS